MAKITISYDSDNISLDDADELCKMIRYREAYMALHEVIGAVRSILKYEEIDEKERILVERIFSSILSRCQGVDLN